MTIIGFDVSKNELVGARINTHSLLKESFALENTADAIRPFLEETRQRYPKLLVASEATAEYHRILAEECITRSIPFRLINPILTKQFTRATIRKQKTDRTDALIIAKLALAGEGTALTAESLRPIKSVSRIAFKLARLERVLAAMAARVERVFPGEVELRATINEPRKAMAEAVKNLRSQLVKNADASLMSLLTSLPGVGPTIATTFVAEVGDAQRFPSGKSLVAFAGLDPKIRQSGLSLKRNTKLTKRGSPYLRKAAYIAAYIAKRHDPELGAYHAKKMLEGKRYKEATVATARKLLYRLYAVWKRGTPYVKRLAPELSTAIV